ncbi:Mov34-domain-containing protein [Ceraceosorus guamensis]|uniref:COP9 signalosome complex subunit 5 n=1 Tax=Ceraceosorus guamensis TaxID=1522189 RepID=A0A316W4I8_9BASI|nr:Mov34-domain-containing protein [Ceraceosorus guamensis]PWN44857.1 Mov34-domain-containing protein [Ceraceosorus guamensis]
MALETAPSSAIQGASSSSTTALKTFDILNDVITLDATDSVFAYDADEQRRILNESPWKKDPHFFQRVRISAVALIKMVMHARSGGIFEVMGLMRGKVDPVTRTLVIMDAFALPVQGTETRVNAQNEAYEYMVEFLESSKAVGQMENIIGWYHSHPGYGCWLSGIDVATQMTNQQFQDPFVAVVIDPNRTISAGKVDIGAFRTYPEGYKPPSAGPSEYQSIPLSKIEDFGVHANSYYPLTIEHFKSSLDTSLLDLLWNKYWASTLSQSPLVVNRSYATGQIKDLSDKLSKAYPSVRQRSSAIAPLSKEDLEADDEQGPHALSSASNEGSNAVTQGANAKHRDVKLTPQRLAKWQEEIGKREEETPLARAARDAIRISDEASHGILAQNLKHTLFNLAGDRGQGASRKGQEQINVAS